MKNITHLILARHGETEWNASEIFRGQADVPLNQRGIKQAYCLGEYLRKEKIDVIYSSPLSRATKTAEAIAVYQLLPVNITPALTDISYGKWQGLTSGDVQQKYPEIYQQWLNTPELARIPGGDSLEDVKNRVVPFLEETLGKYPEKKIVMVSHRVVHKVLICALLKTGNAGFYNIKLDNAGVSRFEFDNGRAVLVSHNDTSYLKSIGGPALADF
jgi:broad specificity phosphatase PhoE